MIPQSLRKPLRAIRHLPDRLLHASRRRRVVARLSRMEVRSAVFVCLGNINRSAYAAARFATDMPSDRQAGTTVRSAGFIGPNRPASELALDISGHRGVNLTAHRSRLVDATELSQTDLIVVMDTTQRKNICRLTGKAEADVIILGDLDPRPIDSRTVQDPYGHPVHVFERVFDRIDRCVGELVMTLWGR